MRKRLISLLLMVCIVASLLSGLTVSAYADGNVVNYTMQGGDTVIGVCKNLGLDFFTCKQAIMVLNKLNSDADFNRLKVGQTIKLPATNADAALIVSSNGTGNTTGNTTGGAVGGTVGGTTGAVNVSSVQLLTGDYVAYYLVPHVVQAGETVYDICNAMGINFHENSDLIMKVNSIQNWNRLFVGRTILLPTTKAPSAGSCIVVVAHKVVGGDTVYTLCQKYGISYKDSLEMLQILNKKENLAVIKVGQVLLMPINGVVTGGGVGGGVVGGGTVGGNTGTGTGTGGTTTLTLRNITTKAPNGTVSIKVDGVANTKSIPGKTVSISVTPNKGYALDGSVVVYLADNSGTVKLNDDGTFVMPDSDVRIEASFVSGYDLKKVNDNAKGSFNLLVNGVATQAAPKGAQVTIKIAPKEGSAVESVSVVGTDSKSSWYAWNDGKQEYTFNMPAEKVTVTVTYKTVASYTLTKGSVSNGTFSLSNANDSIISKSSAGNVVVVVPKANDGYVLDKVSYTYKNGKNDVTTTVTAASDGSYSFQMPAANTTVNVTFKNVDMYQLTKEVSDKRASATLTVGGTEVEKAAAGKTVTVNVTLKAGYKLSSIKVDGVSISGNTFVMPAHDVVVKVMCVEADTYDIWPDGNLSADTAHGSYALKVDGEAVTGLSGKAYEGQVISIEPKPYTNYVLEKITVLNITKNEEIALDSNNSFKMPAAPVRITIKYVLDAPEVAVASATNGTVKTYVGNDAASTAAIGSKVTVKLNADSGYILDTLKVTKADGTELTLTEKTQYKEYEFAMPAEKVTVTATFRPLSHTITTASDSTVGSTFTLKVNDVDVTLNGGSVSAKTGDKITIVPQPATGSALDKIIVTKTGDVNTVVSTSTSFVMPAHDVKITVYFK